MVSFQFPAKQALRLNRSTDNLSPSTTTLADSCLSTNHKRVLRPAPMGSAASIFYSCRKQAIALIENCAPVVSAMAMLRQECLLAARWINGTIGLCPCVSEREKGRSRAELLLFSCSFAVSWRSDQCRRSKGPPLVLVGSAMRVAEPNTRSPGARIACRNAGVGVLRWATRNGNPKGPFL